MVTEVGHYFLKLLGKYFPRHHKLHKIFNRNRVKVSYSCTKNIKSIINCHNKKVLHQNRPCPNERKCNCIRKELCPLNGNCQAENIVYEATITCNERTYDKNIYIGIAETTFRKSYSNHKRSFNLPSYKNDTEFSKEFCLNEKLEIGLFKGKNILNRRTELISKCRHKSKHTLLRHDTKD